MKINHKNIAKREKGITVIGAIILLGVVGFMVYVVGFIATPMYLEYYQIRKGLDTVAEEVNSYDVSRNEVAKRITRHFSLEYVSAYNYHKPIIKKKGGKITVDLIYQDKRKIFDKLNMLLDVNETVQLFP